MRGKKKTIIFVSSVLALSLSLTACSTDPDDGGTDNGVPTTVDQVTTTTLP